jgi:hypothetical protein
MKKIILVVFIASLLSACNNDVKQKEVNEEIIGTTVVTSNLGSPSGMGFYESLLKNFKAVIYTYADRDSFTFYKTSETKTPYDFDSIVYVDYANTEVISLWLDGWEMDTMIITPMDYSIITNTFELKINWKKNDGKLIGSPVAIGFYLTNVDSNFDISKPQFWMKYEDVEKYFSSYYLDIINKALFLGTMTNLSLYPDELYIGGMDNITNEYSEKRAFNVFSEEEDMEILYKIRIEALKMENINCYITDSVFLEPGKYSNYTKEELRKRGGIEETIELELEDGWQIDTTITTELSKDQMLSFAVSEVWEHDVENNLYIKKENRAFAIIYKHYIMDRSFELPLFWLKPDDLKSILSEEEYQKVLEAVDNSLIK